MGSKTFHFAIPPPSKFHNAGCSYILWGIPHNDHPVIRVLIHLLWCCCWHFNPVATKLSFIPGFRDSWVQAAIEAAGWVSQLTHEWHMPRFPIFCAKKRRRLYYQNQHKNGFRTGLLISNFTIQFAILAHLLIRFLREKIILKEALFIIIKVGSWSSGVIHASSQAVQDLVDQSLQRWRHGWMIGIFTWMCSFFTTSQPFQGFQENIGKMSHVSSQNRFHKFAYQPKKYCKWFFYPSWMFLFFYWCQGGGLWFGPSPIFTYHYQFPPNPTTLVPRHKDP